MELVKKILIWGSLAGVLYLLLGFHYIYFGGRTVKVIKKTNYTLMETFSDFSSEMMTNRKILKIDALREAGIADVLVDIGRMTEDQKEKILAEFEEEGY